MRENRTYGLMRGRAYPERDAPPYSTKSNNPLGEPKQSVGEDGRPRRWRRADQLVENVRPAAHKGASQMKLRRFTSAIRKGRAPLLLWEQLSRANRVRFCPSAFRVAMALQLIDASAEDALPQKSQLCLTLIRNPQPSPRLHCIVRLQGCNLGHALVCIGVLALTRDGTS